MSDNLATNTTFLSGEGEGGGGRSKKISGRGMEKVSPVEANEQLDVAQGEGGSIVAATSVFTGTKEKKECNDNHIRNGLQCGVRGVGSNNAKGVMDDTDGDWLNTVRGRVGFGIGAQLTLEAEVNGAKGVLA
jgi:hypothetical protein